jgi:deoxyribonuclease-4
MLRLGAHESIAGGVYRAFDRAESVGCDTVQIFVKPNRAWAFNTMTPEDVARFRERREETGITPVVGHASYLLNLASPKEDLWIRSRDTLIGELERCEMLGAIGLVLHPGAHVGKGEAAGLRRVARALGQVHAATPGFEVQILLETTAGQGTSLGASFEQLAQLIDVTPEGERLGICLDTCHIFAAGYELRTPEGYAATMAAFDRSIGLERLEAIHLNDSQYGLGEKRDRHEHIGRGAIGLDGFRNLLNDPRLEGLPGLIETKKSPDLHEDAENLAVLRSLVEVKGE